MDARTNIKARLPSRHATEGPARARTPFDVAEIFKKTPYAVDSKPRSRDVAKDMFEVGGIPLLMKTLPHGFLHAECTTVAGRKPEKIRHADV
jgi:dihydroxyacid dehydratase/phosphogluconate dehydratase